MADIITGYINTTGINKANRVIKYNLQYKNVKNINMRIKADGSIWVSANKYVPDKVIENFVLSKQDFIVKALEKISQKAKITPIKYFGEEQVKEVILNLCKDVYPYFKAKGIRYPEIRFKKMVSRWGSCQPKKGILTFNTNLMLTPKECIKYVVLHEFTHFLVANHSKEFYFELSKTCPEWKEYREKLKEINISR